MYWMKLEQSKAEVEPEGAPKRYLTPKYFLPSVMILSALLDAAETCGVYPMANPVNPMIAQRLTLIIFRMSACLKLMSLLFPPSYWCSGFTFISIAN